MSDFDRYLERKQAIYNVVFTIVGLLGFAIVGAVVFLIGRWLFQ